MRINLNIGELASEILKSLILFVIGFGLIHAFQLLLIDGWVAMAYILAAIGFSLVFPKLFFTKREGFVYNYMIHLMAYDLAAIGFRLI